MEGQDIKQLHQTPNICSLNQIDFTLQALKEAKCSKLPSVFFIGSNIRNVEIHLRRGVKNYVQT
jgi:hypothetical protein